MHAHVCFCALLCFHFSWVYPSELELVGHVITVLTLLRSRPGTPLVAQWLRVCLTVQGMWVQSLVRGLGFHMLWNSCARVSQILSPCATASLCPAAEALCAAARARHSRGNGCWNSCRTSPQDPHFSHQ